MCSLTECSQHEAGSRISLDVEMSLGEAKTMPQPHWGHAATEWQSLDSNPDSQMGRLVLGDGVYLCDT